MYRVQKSCNQRSLKVTFESDFVKACNLQIAEDGAVSTVSPEQRKFG